jgi:hypothetical protein
MRIDQCVGCAKSSKDRFVLSYEIQKTTNFRFQFNKLSLRFKRIAEEAIDVIKESPMEYQGKITHLANKKEGGFYRFRLPGCYLLYIVPMHETGVTTVVTLTGVKML